MRGGHLSGRPAYLSCLKIARRRVISFTLSAMQPVEAAALIGVGGSAIVAVVSYVATTLATCWTLVNMAPARICPVTALRLGQWLSGGAAFPADSALGSAGAPGCVLLGYVWSSDSMLRGWDRLLVLRRLFRR